MTIERRKQIREDASNFAKNSLPVRSHDQSTILYLANIILELTAEEPFWIPCNRQMPTTEVLLLTSSRVMIIGDFYNGSWRTHRSKWVEKDGKNILESAYNVQDIVAWQPLPSTLWKQLYEREPAPEQKPYIGVTPIAGIIDEHLKSLKVEDKTVTEGNILPCPFCGSRPEWYGEAIPDGHYSLRCPECQYIMRVDRRDKVIGLWNRRADHKPKDENQESGSCGYPKCGCIRGKETCIDLNFNYDKYARRVSENSAHGEGEGSDT